MSVLFREFGQAILSAIIAALVLVLFFQFSSKAVGVHENVLANHNYDAKTENTLDAKLTHDYFELDKGSTKFSTALKTVAWLQNNGYLTVIKPSGESINYSMTPFSSEEAGLYAVKITLKTTTQSKEIKFTVRVNE